MRDSAGIEIVQSPAMSWPGDAIWQLESDPILRLGGQEGDSTTFFFEVTGAAFLQDGRIVVANAGGPDVRVFSPEGVPLSLLGQRGEGPGEFQWVSAIHEMASDSLLAYDNRAGRITIYSKDGDLGRTTRIEVPPGRPPSNVIPLSDGSLLVVRAGRNIPPGTTDWSGLTTSPAVYMKFDGRGQLLDTLFTTPGDEYFLLDTRSGSPGAYRIVLYGLNHTFAVDPSAGKVFGRAGRGRAIARYDLSGRLETIIRWAGGSRSIDPERADSVLLEMLDGDRSEARRYNVPLPESEPGFGRLLWDAEGYLWVSSYSQYDEDPRIWWIFDAEGFLLGTVEVPPEFAVYEVDHGRVLGRRIDPLGREVIEVLSLDRSMRPPGA